MKRLLFILILLPVFAHAQIITTVAGNGSTGYTGDGGLATSAHIGNPDCITFDNSGNYYFSEANNTIRSVSAAGIINTFAGTGTAGFSGDGGPATAAEFNFYPYGGIVFNSISNNIYIADYHNARIRKIAVATGIVSTYAGTGVSGYAGDGGPATAALISLPTDVTIDTYGDLYIIDDSFRIRKVDTNGIITTIAGTGIMGDTGDGGPATAAEIEGGDGMCIGNRTSLEGNHTALFFTDGIRVRQIDLTTGIITTIAGNGIPGFSGDGGPATAAQFATIYGVAIDAAGKMYVCDGGNNRIRVVDTFGIINTFAGNGTAAYSGDGAAATTAELYSPQELFIDVCGNLYITDEYNHRIRKVTLDTPVLTTPTISISGPIGALPASLVTINATVANAGSSYIIHWLNHGIEFTITTVPSVTYTKTTHIDTITARVVSTATYGCYDSTTSEQIIVLVGEGIKPLTPKGELLIYPNPVSDVLHIDGVSLQVQYSLLSIVGAVMQTGSLKAGSNHIVVRALPVGMYMVVVTGSDGGRVIKRVVRQ